MMCFSVQKLKTRFNGGEQTANTEDSSTVSVEADDATSSPTSSAFLSTRKTFRSRARVIQSALRFLNCTPRSRSSRLVSYGSSNNGVPNSGLLLFPQGGHARSASELGFDFSAATHPPHIDEASANVPSPRLLPSPHDAAQLLHAYRLPLPSESANSTSLHPSPSQLNSPRTGKNPSQGQSGNNNPELSSANLITPMAWTKASEPELQPLPPPKDPTTASALRCFSYEELASACQNFCPDCCFDDADACFYGAIKVKVSGKANKHQDVVIVRPNETQQQGLQEWISQLLMVAQELREHPHVCKLVGFYRKNGCMEHMMVYEKLGKGSLCTVLFEESGAPPLDWAMRIKIAYGAAQGLASLHERFPDKVLYKDFRASSIQVDGDHTSKISGYRLVDSQIAYTQTSHNNPRANAYRAPETMSRGELTQRSNVWSFGVILLELLSGKQNMDEQTTRDERHNLVKWAKPFLIDEEKLFLLMDPKLKGNFPLRGAKVVADLVMLCLHTDPTKRPTIREALNTLKNMHELQHTQVWSSTKEPTNSHMFSSSPSAPLPALDAFSMKPVPTNDQRSYHRLPMKFNIIESPALRPLTIPPRCCGEDIAHDYTPPPLAHVEL